MNAMQKRILDYLSQHPASSAAELARVLDVSAANIRHHMGILRNAAMIEVVTRRAADGRGRPTNLFRLSAVAQKHNLAALSAHLLACAMSELDPAGQDAYLRRLAARMAAPASGNLTRRLTSLVLYLNQHAYQARWEAHASAPRVMLARCPYASILPDHPELCQLDAHLLEAVLGAPVTQLARIDLEQGKAPACVFSLLPSGLSKNVQNV